MKKLGIIFFLLIYLISVSADTYYNKHVFQGKENISYKNVDLFKYILDKTSSKPTECGVMIVFTTANDGAETANKVLMKLNKYYKFYKKVCDGNKVYSVEFNGDCIEGYIQSVQYKKYDMITLNVIKRGTSYELQDMKTNITKCIPLNSGKYKCFEYIKAKVGDGNTKILNNQIKKILEYWDTCNIKTLPLAQGYTNTAYTGRYETIQNNGELIDFNYAVMKYDMGTYIIMGTPEIMAVY